MRLTLLILLSLSLFTLRGSNKGEIDSLHQRAYRLMDSNPDSALVLGILAEVKAANSGMDLEEALSLFIQAYVYRQQEELGKAFLLYLKALELLRPLQSEKAIVNYVKILLNTGAILDLHYAYPQALKYYDEGINVAQEHKLNERLIRLYYNKAETLRQFEKLDEALSTINLALNLAMSQKDEQRILSSLNMRGLIFKDMGRYEDARISYRQILDFAYDKEPSARYRSQAWHNTAVTYLEEQRYKEAETAYLNAAAENLKRPGSRENFIGWMDLGETYYLMGRYQEANEAAERALGLFNQVLSTPDHYALFNLLANIYHELGQYEQARIYNERFVTANKHFLEAQKEILQVKDQYKMEILTAGFFQELEASKTEKQYRLMLLFCVIGFCGFIIYDKTRQYYIRRNIKKAILKIHFEDDI